MKTIERILLLVAAILAMASLTGCIVFSCWSVSPPPASVRRVRETLIENHLPVSNQGPDVLSLTTTGTRGPAKESEQK